MSEKAYTWQGTRPTVTVTSSWLPVSRSFPVMVMTVPPAAGPLDGSTLVGLGSWWQDKGSAAEFAYVSSSNYRNLTRHKA